MSQFADFHAAGFKLAADFLGEAITYTPAGGSPIAITAIVGPETQIEEAGSTGGVQVRYERSVTVPLVSVGNPTVRDKVTIGSAVWSVSGSTAKVGGSVEVKLQRIVTLERGGRNLRQIGK